MTQLRMICFGTVMMLLATTEIANATVIAARTGAGEINDMNPGIAVQWMLTQSFTNVSIAATIASGRAGPGEGTFYLTDAFGPGTTTANELARVAVFNVPFANGFIPPPTLLFSGLTLGPGAYFLIEASDLAPHGLGWIGLNAPLETESPGTTIGADLFTTTLAGYPPATPNFTLGTHQFLFSVDGNPLSVPEPSTIFLFFAGLVLLAINRLTRTGWHRELAGLRHKKIYANNNLAGATYEQSIPTENASCLGKVQD